MNKLTHNNYLILVSEDKETKEHLIETLNKVYKEVKDEHRSIINVTVMNAELGIDMDEYKKHLDSMMDDNKVQITIILNPSKLELDMYLIHEKIVTLNINTNEDILYYNSGKYKDCKFDFEKYPPREI